MACIILSTDQGLQTSLNSMEQLMVDFAQEFGEKCGIFSMLDSLIDAAKDFLEPLEQAMKKVTDVISKVYNQIKSVLDGFVGLLQEGLDLIKGAIASALNMFNEVIGAINGAMDQLRSAIGQATNALASALCNTLNSAITGMPSDVVLKTPGLLAVKEFDKIDPRKGIKDALLKSGIMQQKALIENQVNRLNDIGNIPNIRKYACTS
jgi:flagellar biosynthesis chaperone FliJ